MIEIKRKQAYNKVDAWEDTMMQSKWKLFLDMSFFLVIVVVGENIDDLKFNTFFFFLEGRGGGEGEGNDQ